MIEALCSKCSETFVPHSEEPDDLVHGITEAGDECGGVGIVLGEWVAPSPFTVGLVNLEGGQSVLAQYPTHVRWNGYLCPSMDAHACQTILAFLHRLDPDNITHRWDEDGRLVVCQHDYADVYEADADGLYALGAWGWVWTEAGA